MSATIDVDRLIDEQKIGRFNVMIVAWSFLAMLADGYEITAMAFAAPELVRVWGVETSSLGPVFSASLFGVLFGAPLLGWVGDRYGRRVAIILACVICGVATLSMVATTNLQQMFALRFIAGIGIGGLMPNTISLTSELSPKKFRAMLIVLMFTGITLGSGSPSVIAATLVPQYGWQVLFLIGGVFPLAVAACLVFYLPESIKFLAVRKLRPEKLLQTARRARPDLVIPATAEFVVRRAEAGGTAGLGIRQIFAGGLAWITPLLWFCFAATLMANFFLNSWMPVLFERSGMDPEQAALASGLYHVGGTLGGLLISVLIDRYGVLVIAVFLALAGPVVAAIGLAGLPQAALLALSLGAGVCVLGAQFGNNASAGMIYPTEVRAKAVGWAFSIGRFGSILGPIVGGVLIAQDSSLASMLLVAAAPLVLGALAAMQLTRLCHRRYGGLRLDDQPVQDGVA
ncbi:MAG: MFS transporter [Gammaproteobacteria bacterium]|nr:MFS transporter [Gammaproteobacteria bacterium]MDH4253306.1 MFS transporter [Gammaproteobacteria bacterium]MDH5310536.1 MFS transporter [Gammaproteobacteria bacterium]